MESGDCTRLVWLLWKTCLCIMFVCQGGSSSRVMLNCFVCLYDYPARPFLGLAPPLRMSNIDWSAVSCSHSSSSLTLAWSLHSNCQSCSTALISSELSSQPHVRHTTQAMTLDKVLVNGDYHRHWIFFFTFCITYFAERAGPAMNNPATACPLQYNLPLWVAWQVIMSWQQAILAMSIDWI